MMKSKRTNKKFYNKWLYKISIRMAGASGFRMYSPQQLVDICLGNRGSVWVDSRLATVLLNNSAVLKISDYLKDKDPSMWSKRVEGKCLDVYTNDAKIFNDLSLMFEKETIHRFEPDVDALLNLEKANTIVGKRLPHDKYQYRVYLLPHKLAFDADSKAKYISWIKAQAPRITFTESIERWFISTNFNWDRRYVLVEDEQTLLMLKLRNAEVVGRIYNYVVADK